MQTQPGKYAWERKYVWGSERDVYKTDHEVVCPHCGELVEVMRIGETSERLLVTHHGLPTDYYCDGSALIVSTIRYPEAMQVEIEQGIDRAIRSLKLNNGQVTHEDPQDL